MYKKIVLALAALSTAAGVAIATGADIPAASNSYLASAYCALTGCTMTGGVTFSAVATDITTGTNEDLNIVPNGTGNITYTKNSGAGGSVMMTLTNGTATGSQSFALANASFGQGNASYSDADFQDKVFLHSNSKTLTFARGDNVAAGTTAFDFRDDANASGAAGAILMSIDGIGKVTDSVQSQASTAETLHQWSVSDATNDRLSIYNGSVTDTQFQPVMQFYNDSASAGSAGIVRAVTSAAADTGTAQMFSIQAARGTANTITAAIVTRPILAIINYTTALLTMDVAGNIKLDSGATKTRGTITLAAGTGTAAVATGAICTCTDTTAANVVKCAVSVSTLTATGTGTDVIAYLCF